MKRRYTTVFEFTRTDGEVVYGVFDGDTWCRCGVCAKGSHFVSVSDSHTEFECDECRAPLDIKGPFKTEKWEIKSSDGGVYGKRN